MRRSTATMLRAAVIVLAGLGLYAIWRKRTAS
jgi:hypothetical protein